MEIALFLGGRQLVAYRQRHSDRATCMFWIELFVLESSYKIRSHLNGHICNPWSFLTSHKLLYVGHWFILTYNLVWEDQSSCDQTKLGYISISPQELNTHHSFQQLQILALLVVLWNMLSENWIWSLPSCLTACILCHKYNHLCPTSEVVRTILRSEAPTKSSY